MIRRTPRRLKTSWLSAPHGGLRLRALIGEAGESLLALVLWGLCLVLGLNLGWDFVPAGLQTAAAGSLVWVGLFVAFLALLGPGDP